MADDTRTLSRNELGVLAAGLGVLVFSIIPAFTVVTFEGPGQDESFTAWGGMSTIGVVLLLLATALVGVTAMSATALPKVVPWHLVTVVLAVLGTLLVILRAMTVGSDKPGASVATGWSGWLLILAAIALTVFAVLKFRESGDELDFSDAVQDD